MMLRVSEIDEKLKLLQPFPGFYLSVFAFPTLIDRYFVKK